MKMMMLTMSTNVKGSGKQHEVEASRPREAPKQLLLMFTGLLFCSQGENEDSLLILLMMMIVQGWPSAGLGAAQL